jgi:hypothetical protein
VSRRANSPRRTVISCSRSRRLRAIRARSAVLRSRRSCNRRVWSRRLENSSLKPGKRQYKKPTPPAPRRREKTPVHSQMLPGRAREKGPESAEAGRLASGGRIAGQRRSSTGLHPPKLRRTAIDTTEEPAQLVRWASMRRDVQAWPRFSIRGGGGVIINQCEPCMGFPYIAVITGCLSTGPGAVPGRGQCQRGVRAA